MKYLFRAWWWLCKYGSSVPVCFIDSKSNLICKLVSLLKGILAVTHKLQMGCDSEDVFSWLLKCLPPSHCFCNYNLLAAPMSGFILPFCNCFGFSGFTEAYDSLVRQVC